MTSVNADAAPTKRGRGRPLSWTPDVDATIKRMAIAGYSDAEIAKHLGRNPDVVSRRRRQLGLPRNYAIQRMLCRLNIRRALKPT
jgi:IS30 family transposase